MDKLRSILIVGPAFLLGCLVSATLTTTAKASPEDVQTKAKPEKPMYRIVTNEADLNKYAEEGYTVKEMSSTANWTNILMQRYR